MKTQRISITKRFWSNNPNEQFAVSVTFLMSFEERKKFNQNITDTIKETLQNV